MTASPPATAAPNHHANHPGFAGPTGLLIGLTMTIARGNINRLAANLTAVTAADHVVDVGAGPGGAARVAARRGATVTGVDPASVMRRLAGWLTRGRSVTYVDGTAEALPLADASATVLWSIATVHHWGDVGTGLSEAVRVLGPGGRLLAIERRVRPGAKGLGSHGWTDAQADVFAAACRDAGCTDVRVERRTIPRHTLLTVQATAP